ncbi:MAG: hypothetical protein Q9222_002393, partial [Ikaeria aurantiellina]
MDPSSPSPPPQNPDIDNVPTTLPHPLPRPISDSALSNLYSTTKAKSTRKTTSHRRRARSAASSRAGSINGSDFSMEDYSIDLAKLGDKDSSWTIGKAGERDIERVSSRDEGPEDFTLRMGDWMRGTMPWNGVPQSKDGDVPDSDGDRKKSDEQETRRGGASPDMLESKDEADVDGQSQVVYEADDESDMEPLSTSTPAVGSRQLSNKHSSAPPFSRMNTEAMQELAAQEVFDQISALQAEVERLRLESRDHLAAKISSERTQSQQEKEQRALKVQVDDLRSEAKRLQDSEFKASQKALRLEQELKKDGSKVGSLRAKFEPLTQELDTVKLRAEADKQAADSTINALKADLKTSRDQNARLQAVCAMEASAHATDIETLKMEISACQTKFQHREDILKEQLQAKDSALLTFKEAEAKATAVIPSNAELEEAKEQLLETRRILQNVEEENELFARESEQHAQEVLDLKRALEEERLQTSSSADAELAELRDEIARMQAQKTADMISYSEHQADLDQLENEHVAATESLTAKHKKELHTLRSAIIKAGEGMKKREDRFTAAHEKEAKDLQAQVKKLDKQLKAATSTKQPAQTIPDDEHPTVLELRSAITVLNNRLLASHADIKTLSNQLLHFKLEAVQATQQAEKAKSYIKTMKQDNKDINEELDRRMEKKMEEREREWRRRIKVVFKDREAIAR